MQEEEAAITQTLVDYYRAFSTLDANSAVEYFHEPAMLMNRQGVFAAPTRPELAAVFTPVMEGLRNQRYGGSELSVQQITNLGSAASSVTGIAIRRKLDGSELERVDVTYVLHKTGNDWAIAVMIMHGKDEPPTG